MTGASRLRRVSVGGGLMIVTMGPEAGSASPEIVTQRGLTPEGIVTHRACSDQGELIKPI